MPITTSVEAITKVRKPGQIATIPHPRVKIPIPSSMPALRPRVSAKAAKNGAMIPKNERTEKAVAKAARSTPIPLANRGSKG